MKKNSKPEFHSLSSNHFQLTPAYNFFEILEIIKPLWIAKSIKDKQKIRQLKTKNSTFHLARFTKVYNSDILIEIEALHMIRNSVHQHHHWSSWFFFNPSFFLLYFLLVLRTIQFPHFQFTFISQKKKSK